MKTYAQISLNEDEVGHDLYEKVGRLYPEARGPYRFGICCLDMGDPRTQEVLNVLKAAGYQPYADKGPLEPGNFPMTMTRVYDKRDIDEADYLLPQPGKTFDDVVRSSAGHLVLEINRRSALIHFGSSWHGLIVSNDFKRLVERAGLEHLTYRAVEVVGGKGMAILAPYWELESDLVLPPLAPRMFFVTATGEVFRGDYKEGCLPREGGTIPDILYRPPELHYEASAMRSVPEFDLALTQERLGRPFELRQELVCSQRFCRFCTANRYKVEWLPVHVDA